MPRRSLLPALLATVLAALAGCGGGGEPEPATADQQRGLSKDAQRALEETAGAADDAPPTQEERVRARLEDRAAALARGDADALRETSAGTAQEAHDRRWARRLERAPLASARYEQVRIEIEDGRANVSAALVYRLRGIPRRFTTYRGMELAGANGWRVLADVGIDERVPWEVAPFTARRGRHVLLLTAPGANVPGLLADLEHAYGKVSRTLPRRPLPERVLALSLASVAQGKRLTRLFNRSLAAMDDVTYQFGPLPAGAAERVLSQRVLVDASFFRRMLRPARRSLLAHELVHVALDPKAAQRTPAWLFEGLAMYLSGDRLGGPDVAAEGAAIARETGLGISDLCDPDAISKRRGRAQLDAYVVSTAAVDAIVRRHGRRGALELHDAFRDTSITGSACRATELALRDRLGMSIDELDRALAAG